MSTPAVSHKKDANSTVDLFVSTALTHHATSLAGIYKELSEQDTKIVQFTGDLLDKIKDLRLMMADHETHVNAHLTSIDLRLTRLEKIVETLHPAISIAVSLPPSGAEIESDLKKMHPQTQEHKT